MDNVERVASEVLRAAGSSLKHYTPQNRERIIAATTAAIAAMEGWRPIVEAPLDGTTVDVWIKGDGRITDAWFNGHRWLHWGQNGFEQMDDVPVRGEITHFRPLPAPPQHGGVDG